VGTSDERNSERGFNDHRRDPSFYRLTSEPLA
jgi:hypothetical protein